MPRSIRKEFPEIFIDWHPTLNGSVNPSTLRRTSRKKYWWRCHNKKCGCNWKATIYARLHLGDICPKCKERKKKKFTQDLLEIKKIFKKIKVLQLQADKHIELFIADDMTRVSRQRNSVIVRRTIDKINVLNLQFRKIILSYNKRMLEYKIKSKKENE